MAEGRVSDHFIAPPGWQLIAAVHPQIEMRIVNKLSRDSEMMQCFQLGIDIHWRTLMSSIGRGVEYAEQIQKTAAMYCTYGKKN